MDDTNYVGTTVVIQVSQLPWSDLFCEVSVFSEVDMLGSSPFPGLCYHRCLLCHPNWR